MVLDRIGNRCCGGMVNSLLFPGLTPYLDRQLVIFIIVAAADKFIDLCQVPFINPVKYEPVRCQETDRITVFDCVKRSYPGIELLRG